ncbi:SRPBCC domain-containing protein [Arthrobacter sp. NPDC090010]|uniref:SRPBCC domain-containing protein n=1 Tax=Arthrobacter sp. NPDC090010 TaxID=3363942 RepID=UPI0037FAF5ED
MSHIDEASRFIAVGQARIFAALMDGEALEHWLPPSGMSGVMERFEPVLGGEYRMVLRYLDPSGAPGKATADSDIVQGRISRIIPDREVAHEIRFVSDDPAYAGLMTMRWILEEQAGGTLVRIRAEGVPDGISPTDHADGMDASLTNLARYLGTG